MAPITYLYPLWIRTMIEKVEYEKDKINALLTELPKENQSFYYDLLNNNVLDDQAYKDVFYLLNYELTQLSIQTKHIDTISTEDLNQLTPWVRDENRKAWSEMLQTTPAHEVCPYFSLLLESRKKILMLPLDTLKSEDLESMLPGIMKSQKEYMALANEEEESCLKSHSNALNLLKNQADINLHIGTLFDLVKDNEELVTFYQNILAYKHDEPFKVRLIRVLRMEIAMSALNEHLEITQLKLDRIIAMLDEDIRQEYKNPTIKKLEPIALHDLLKTELNLLKNDLQCHIKEQFIHVEQEKIRQEQLQREQQDKVLQLQRIREQQQKEIDEQILQEKQEKKRQVPLLQILNDIHFDEYLEIFNHKAAHYGESNTDAYQLALNATNTLISDLIMAKNAFLSTKDISPVKLEASFKNKCLLAIETAKEVLQEHRGWKEILANFASAIVSVASLGIANYLTSRGFFNLFPTKTDGAEKLDGFLLMLN